MKKLNCLNATLTTLVAAAIFAPAPGASADVIRLTAFNRDAGYGIAPATFTTAPELGVDGYFRPNTTGTTVVTSTGVTADLSALSSTNNVFGSIFAEIAAGASIDPVNNDTPTTNDVAVTDAFYLNTNGAVTFDLSEIVPVGETATQLSFIYAYTRPNATTQRDTIVTYAALVDGVITSTGSLNPGNGGFEEFTSEIIVPLTATSRFITLVSADGNDGNGNDNTAFINPTVTTVVPEPGSLALLGLGGLLMMSRRKGLAAVSVPTSPGAD